MTDSAPQLPYFYCLSLEAARQRDFSEVALAIRPDIFQARLPMLLHVVADQPDRISTLRMLLGSQCRLSSSLLHKENNVPKDCGAAIVSVDLRNADNIVALKELAAKFKGAKRKILSLIHI